MRFSSKSVTTIQRTPVTGSTYSMTSQFTPSVQGGAWPPGPSLRRGARLAGARNAAALGSTGRLGLRTPWQRPLVHMSSEVFGSPSSHSVPSGWFDDVQPLPVQVVVRQVELPWHEPPKHWS